MDIDIAISGRARPIPGAGGVPHSAKPGKFQFLEMYLKGIMSRFDEAQPASADRRRASPDQVFEVLTGREFCYLSKTKASPFREDILSLLAEPMRRQQPLHFYYDIGGGYHATPRLGEPLSFHVGLAELLLLGQVALFSAKIESFYHPGAKFSLVVDNMCALLINDIPLSSTIGYCRELKGLIRRVGLHHGVDLLIESDHVSVADFDRLRKQAPLAGGAVPVNGKQHDNVERFLGRRCDAVEAAERTSRYREVIHASERLLTPLITSVHMTQRASATTICFRPFPGGDCRIQCGEVVLATNDKQKVHPILMTTNNAREYSCRRYEFPGVVPSGISYITHAERIAG